MSVIPYSPLPVAKPQSKVLVLPAPQPAPQPAPPPSAQQIGSSIGKGIGFFIDLFSDKKGKSSQKALPPTSDTKLITYSGDPGLMRQVPSLDASGYYYEPTYGYSSEPWGPGLVDTFRGSGLPDPFFV